MLLCWNPVKQINYASAGPLRTNWLGYVKVLFPSLTTEVPLNKSFEKVRLEHLIDWRLRPEILQPPVLNVRTFLNEWRWKQRTGLRPQHLHFNLSSCEMRWTRGWVGFNTANVLFYPSHMSSFLLDISCLFLITPKDPQAPLQQLPLTPKSRLCASVLSLPSFLSDAAAAGIIVQTVMFLSSGSLCGHSAGTAAHCWKKQWL